MDDIAGTFPLERVIGRLEDLGRSIKGGMAQCPAHDDSTPSLSIKTGKEGRVLLYCHAGCPLEAILDALGLEKRDLFSTPYLPLGLGQGLRGEAVRVNGLPRGTQREEEKGAPELLELLEDFEKGGLQPHPVILGPLPDRATDDMRAVAADIALLIGLRAAVCEDRPLPYSRRFCASRMGWSDPKRAARALRKLVAVGVIRSVGEMPARGMPYGTKLYAPPLAIAERPPLELVERQGVA